MATDSLMRIGELARRTGVATSASAERVALIHLCQDAGFTLGETGRLLAARIRRAQRARALIQHALDCPHGDLLTCPNLRSAVEARLDVTATE